MKEENKINASWSKIMEDGASAAKYYMSCAVTDIDKMFGEGYAAQHPELVGAYIKAAATEAQGNVIGKCMQLCSDDFSERIEQIADSLYTLSIKLEKKK